MPYVNIKVTDEGVTREQKARLIEGVTALLHDVLGKAPASTYVVIDQVALSNWGVGGVDVERWREQQRS
ncbi:tautomerase family protein [Nocardia abscessus]|uniref:tautomerase family protein n=1 Tax=Nocardia abscessus TaxID=120957 RepID=UPI0024580DB1|nr:4-oxalocrotonate tautomerase family protein [Nocardia abscessus]